jgi:nucleoid-associated protein YgaU
MKKTLILVLALAMGGCSLSGPKTDEPTVRADDLEFAVDTLEEPAAPTEDINVSPEKISEAKIPDEYQAPPVEEVAMIEPEEPKFEEFTKPESQPVVAVEAPEVMKVPEEIVIIPSAHEAPHATREVATGSSFEYYRVQRGDTLMMISFKIYGDYRKWKELAEWNKDKLKTKISAGTELKYYVPNEKFGWVPVGLPHLVKTGETLSIISKDKYGTPKKWKSIYDNNRPLIRNPNLIFAGFTLYYQPTRQLASQPR